MNIIIHQEARGSRTRRDDFDLLHHVLTTQIWCQPTDQLSESQSEWPQIYILWSWSFSASLITHDILTDNQIQIMHNSTYETLEKRQHSKQTKPKG